MNFLYLLVDLGAIAVPLLFSFHPKIQLYKRWHLLWPAILLSLVPFVIWDSYFTKIGVWGFNPKYLVGTYLFGLPIEEILFFVCIPYACLFTYYCFRIYHKTDYTLKNENLITGIFLCFTLAMGITYYDRYYTSWTAVGLVAFLLFLKFIVKARWLSLFYFSHMFLLIPFFIVNGILTGSGLDEPVVWYNNAENIGIRIFTIPFEDIFYGMLMLLLNTFLFEYLLAKYPVPETENLEPVSVGQ